jgi:biotin transport system substrate-specific component
MSVAYGSPRVLVETIRTAWVRDIALVAASVAFIAGAAQVSIPLPFSPVPLTGQTFAVLLSCAALGTWRSVIATSSYALLAVAGLPVLAPKEDGSHVTGLAVFSMASLGYVLGFIVAAFVVGRVAERGWTKTPARAALVMVFGNLSIYAVGVPVLAAVTGADAATALEWGLYPFLIGDAIKIALAAGLLPSAWAAISSLHRND